MIKYENRCVDCGLPCIRCRNSNVPVLYCDDCGEEVDVLYELDAEELCEDCVLKSLKKVEVEE